MSEQFKILVVESDAASRDSLISAIKRLHPHVMHASTAEDGIELVRKELPNFVFIDVNMPGTNGPELTRAIAGACSQTLIAAVTEPAQARAAVESIKAGAHDYLQRPVVFQELRTVLARFSEISARRRSTILGPDSVRKAEIHLELRSSSSVVTPAVALILGLLRGVIDERESMRMELALHEMIRNAYEHGNLGLSYDEKAALCESGTLEKVLAERSKTAVAEGKMIVVDAALENGVFSCAVADDGAGFDWRQGIDPTESVEKLSGLSGRGLFLIRRYFDSVRFNESGNRIEVTKRVLSAR